MEFEQAFEMVLNIHRQTGDSHSWKNLKCALEDEVKRYKSGREMMMDLYRRTDLSQDDSWAFEEMDESIKVLFALMYPLETKEGV